MRRSATQAAAALTLGLAIAAPTAAASSPKVAGQAVTQPPAAVRDYWTPERMREAEPLDAPTGFGDERGPLASVAAQPPDLETDPALDTAYPQRVHGRLFMRFGADDSSCSATVVRSYARNLILTAGHCVVTPTAGGPQWAANVAFVPGYRDDLRPLGTYVATSLRAPGIWAFEGDISFDVGAINLAPGASGPIQDALGARGITFDRLGSDFKGKRFKVFGYPADPVAFYDGRRLIVCDSPFQGFERFSGAVKTGPCHQQQGASGGGFIFGKGLLASVVSHGACKQDSDACQVMSGTYFGNLVFSLYAKAGGGLPKGVKKRIARCRGRGRGKGPKTRRCLIRARTVQPIAR